MNSVQYQDLWKTTFGIIYKLSFIMQIKFLSTSQLIYWTVGVIAIAAGLVVWFNYSPAPAPTLVEGEFEQLPVGKIYKTPQVLEAFQLVDHQGETFDLNRLKGKWSFLFFGYTHCPDVCPMTLLTYKEMHRQLVERLNDLSDIQFIFVSVDPKRDTIELLDQYVTHFHPDFIGVTGSENAIRDFTKPLGIFYRAVERPREETYWVEHSGSILLVDPRARLFAVFPAPHHPRDLVTTFINYQ